MALFTNLPSPEKAVAMLAEVDCNDPTSGVKMVGYATKKVCNSGVVAAWV